MFWYLERKPRSRPPKQSSKPPGRCSSRCRVSFGVRLSGRLGGWCHVRWLWSFRLSWGFILRNQFWCLFPSANRWFCYPFCHMGRLAIRTICHVWRRLFEEVHLKRFDFFWRSQSMSGNPKNSLKINFNRPGRHRSSTPRSEQSLLGALYDPGGQGAECVEGLGLWLGVYEEIFCDFDWCLTIFVFIWYLMDFWLIIRIFIWPY